MAAGDNISGMVNPTVGGSSGTWGTTQNSNNNLVDAHDHTSGKGVRIPSSGLNLTTDLSLNGTAALTNVKAVAFTAQASYTTSKSLWVRSSDNELIWRNNSGTDVKLTSGGNLNLSLVGGILGDYAASEAALYYDDAAEAYRFLESSPSPNDWSYVKAGGLDLYEHDSSIANFIGLRSPSALAASYSLTFPGALPGSTSVVQVSSAGVITFSNTFANAITMSSSLTVGTTLGVTGLITASAGVTCAADQHVTVSGNGRYKHGDLVKVITAYAGYQDAGNFDATTGGLISAAADVLYFSPEFDVGERVKSITFALFGNGTTDVTVTVSTMSTSGVATSIGSTTVSNQPASWSDTTIDLTDTTLTDTTAIFISFNVSAAGLTIGNIRITYDRP